MITNRIVRMDPDHLSVIHKAPAPDPDFFEQDLVLKTDLSYHITGWNAAAELIHGRPGAMGRQLFELVQIGFVNSSREAMTRSLDETGAWTGEVSFTRFDGSVYLFRTTATYILDEHARPVSILIVCHNITRARQKEKELAAAERKYEILMNTLHQGVIMMDRELNISACNRRGSEILGIRQDDLLRLDIAHIDFKVLRADGTPMPYTEFPAVVSLQTGFPQRNVVMGFSRGGHPVIWISVNSEALIHPGEFEPYAAVWSFSDMKEKLAREKERRKSNERFFYASGITSDAIWDVDLETREIYRSDAFSRLSGYSREEIGNNLDWWFNKVHPDDRARVRRKVNKHIDQGLHRWEDEYRFECADGTFKHFCDLGIILYENGKPVRIIGAIRDLTEQKKLEKQLLDEQSERHRAITQASMEAQEREKAHISRELHDNVNQILMSAKLFLDTARQDTEKAPRLIDKAIEYQLMAVQEIRKLSRNLSSSHIRAVGLRNSVSDIVGNLQLLKLNVNFMFDERVEAILNDEERLMMFRIIQEQTNNIIKHSGANTVWISVFQKQRKVCLEITDDGIGFDNSQKSAANGIGFINMKSRAAVFNGQLSVTGIPGKGCVLKLCFPVNRS